SLLGLRLEVDRLHVAPCLPEHWEALTIHYRYRETLYHIAVLQTRAAAGEGSAVTSVVVDGVDCPDKAIPLVDDRQVHAAEVRVQAEPGAGTQA
ncbi:MAG: hypothetical protein PVG98_08725, partial [Chromatiales bacterium]